MVHIKCKVHPEREAEFVMPGDGTNTLYLCRECLEAEQKFCDEHSYSMPSYHALDVEQNAND